MGMSYFRKLGNRVTIPTAISLGLVLIEPALDKSAAYEAPIIMENPEPLSDPLFEGVAYEPPEGTGIQNAEEYINHLSEAPRDRILEYEVRYSTNGYIEGVWKNMRYFADIFEKEALEKGIHPKIFLAKAIIEAEHPRQVSSAGAAGQFQLMESTGREYGLRMDKYVDERFDPEKCSAAAAKKFRGQLDAFGNKPEHALLAYNLGEGRMKERGIGKEKSFWDLSIGQIPEESYYHIPKVLAVAKILENPQEYGLNLDKPSVNFKHYIVEKGDTTGKISKKLNTNLEEIERFNPQIRDINSIRPGMKIRYNDCA